MIEQLPLEDRQNPRTQDILDGHFTRNLNYFRLFITVNNLERFLLRLVCLNLRFEDIHLDFSYTKECDIPALRILSSIKDAILTLGLQVDSQGLITSSSKTSYPSPKLSLNFDKFHVEQEHFTEFITLSMCNFSKTKHLNLSFKDNSTLDDLFFYVGIGETLKVMSHITCISISLQNLDKVTENILPMLADDLLTQNIAKNLTRIRLFLDCRNINTRKAIDYLTNKIKRLGVLVFEELYIHIPLICHLPEEMINDFFMTMNNVSPNSQSIIYNSFTNQQITKATIEKLSEKSDSELKDIEYIDVEFTEKSNLEELDIQNFFKVLAKCNKTPLNIRISFNHCKAATDSSVSMLEKLYKESNLKIYNLKLDFVDCQMITDQALRFFADNILIGCKGASLTFENCGKVTDYGLGYLANALVNNRDKFSLYNGAKKSVNLEFNKCKSVSQIGIYNLKNKVKRLGFPSGILVINGDLAF